MPARFSFIPVSRVTTPLRFALLVLCATGLVRGLGAASASSASGTASALPPELAAWLAAQPTWSASATADLSYGYKDNLLLSHLDGERSAFARGSVSLLILRVPTGSFDASSYVQADGTRYFSGRTVDYDAKVWTQTELAYRLGDTFKFSLPITGYYSDQVFDVSDTEIERLVAKLKVTGGMLSPAVRWNFGPRWWIEAQANGERKRYADETNDARVGDGVVRLSWKPTQRIEARVIGSQRWWNFERRTQYTAAGRALAGTHLKTFEREGQARIEITWDQAARWQTYTRLSRIDYRDNGTGYFNYREKKAAQELRWKNECWLVRVEGIARRIDFGVRTVGFGINPPPRIKDEYSAELRVERMLDQRWTLLAGYAWERSRSNDVFASYRVNEGLLGLRWSWEK